MSAGFIAEFKCLQCEKELAYAPTYLAHCSGNLDVQYDYKKMRAKLSRKKVSESKDFTHWRYGSLFPLKSETLRPSSGKIPRVSIGWTPLYRAPKLESDWNISTLYIKDDGRNPSASFKDRASSVVLARGLEEKAARITGASTGNAGSSLACLAASIQFPVTIFVPKARPKPSPASGLWSPTHQWTAPRRVCYSAGSFARVRLVQPQHGVQPLPAKAKSCAYEIAEQLGWKSPTTCWCQ